MLGRLSAASLAAFVVFTAPAKAQYANVLQAGCGSITYDNGSQRPVTMDINGKLCIGGTISATSSISGYTPGGTAANIASVSTTSSNVALPSGTVVAVFNTGATAITVKLGVGAGTSVTTVTGDVIQPGSWFSYTPGTNTYLAAITASGTSSLQITGGSGLPAGAGGGGSGGGGGGGVVTQPTASLLNATVVGTGTFATQTTLAAETTKVIGTTRTLGGGGNTIDFAGQNAASPAASWLIGGQFNTTPTTITSGNSSPFQMDANGNLLVNVKAGGAGGGVVTQPTASQLNATVVGTGTFVTQSTLNAETTKVIGTTRNLGATGNVLDFAGQNAASPPSAWLLGGQFNTTPTTIASGNASPFQMDASGNLLVNVKAGGAGGGSVYGPTAKGTAAANPPVLQGGTVDGTATGAVGVAKVDANGTQTIDAVAAGNLINAINSPIPAGTAAIGNVGTAPRASQLTRAVINFSASGDNVVVTRAVGTIKAYRLSFICAAATTITIKDGTTAITGAMPGVTSLYRGYEGGEPQFVTSGTNNFIINSSVATQCSGDIAYLDN